MRHIPNLLCLLRLILAPWCAALIIARNFPTGLVVFVIAGWTDFFDGFLARKLNWNSKLGTYLDPAADKLFLAAVYVALGIAGVVPWWLVALIFGRDVMILAGAALLYRRIHQRSFPPSMAGKVSTTLQLCAAFVFLAVESGFLPRPLGTLAIWTAAAGTAYSGVDYARNGLAMLRR